VWKKILYIFGLIFTAIATFVLANRARTQGNGQRIADNERDIGKNLDAQRSTIDRQGKAIDRAIDIVGDDQERKSELDAIIRSDAELVRDSQDLRERIKSKLGSGNT
jgi:hypothetical protein